MQIKEIVSKSILTKGGGFIGSFSHTLNPYSGCAFGCKYCYVRMLPIGLYNEEEWGTWVDIKTNAADLLRAELQKAKEKGPVTVFMASATDPYQPLEVKTCLTQSLLEVMLESPSLMPDFLHIQTRSPLVIRDLNIFKLFGNRIRIAMTIETDQDSVRKVFSPAAPPIQARLRTLRQLSDAGIPTQVSMSPILPCSKDVAKVFRAASDHIVIDDFFMGDGSRGKRTEKMGIRTIFEQHGWQKWYSPKAIEQVVNLMKTEFNQVELINEQK